MISDYAHPIRDAADLVAAGRFLRASLGAHPSAWPEAVEELGAISAATAVIYVLQLYEDDVRSGKNSIRNAGGYFRSMIRLIKGGKIDLTAELLALRQHKLAQRCGVSGLQCEVGDSLELRTGPRRTPTHYPKAASLAAQPHLSFGRNPSKGGRPHGLTLGGSREAVRQNC